MIEVYVLLKRFISGKKITKITFLFFEGWKTRKILGMNIFKNLRKEIIESESVLNSLKLEGILFFIIKNHFF